MDIRKTFYKILLFISLFSFLFYFYTKLGDHPRLSGPSLLLSLVSLAFGVRINNFLKGFTYTLLIFAAVALSLQYPSWFIKWGDFEVKSTIVPLLQIIMFGMGSQMSFRDFTGVIKMPKGVLLGLLCQFTIMPVVGFTIASSMGFPPEIAAGFILVGASPSGLASNVMSFIAKANLALSVTLTAIATMLAPLITPTLMKYLAGQFVPIDFWSMMLSIINIVILPIMAGLIFNAIAYGSQARKAILIQLFVYLIIISIKNIIHYQTEYVGVNEAVIAFLKNLAWFVILPIVGGFLFKLIAKGRKEYLDKALSLISMGGIAVIITVITAAGRDSLIEIGLLLILATLLHNLTGYTLGYWICRLSRLDERSCRTIALEVGMQNGGLASGIALEMGKVATIGLAPAVFGPMMNITGSSLATFWRGRQPKDKEKR